MSEAPAKLKHILFLVLYRHRPKGLTLDELCKLFKKHPTTLKPHLGKYVSLGFLKKVKNQGDNQDRYTLTPLGMTELLRNKTSILEYGCKKVMTK